MKKNVTTLSKLVILFLIFASTAFSQPFTGANPLPGKIGYIIGLAPNDPITGPSDHYLKIETPNSNPLFPGQVKIFNSLRLENTINPNIGVLYKGTTRFLHNYGSYNTFLGLSAGNFSMTGATNTGIGYGCLGNNTTGFGNTAMGFYALTGNSTGSGNIAIGESSLGSNTSGSTNTAIGVQSLYINTTGSANTSIGSVSLWSNISGNSNTAIGSNALYKNSSGNSNTALGNLAGLDVITGSNLTLIGYNSQPSSSSATNQVTLGDNLVGSLRCNVQTITSLSDERDKKNIKDLSLGLDFLMKVKPRQFNWDKREWYEGNKSDGSKTMESKTAGFISQELDEVQTIENAEWLNLVMKDNPDKLEATYGNLLPVMVKAIQELKEKNDILSRNNERLALNNENLKSEVETLKSMNEKIVKLEKALNEMAAVKHTSLIDKEVNSTNTK